MPTTLYAACGERSDLQVKRVPVDRDIQQQIGKIFQEQKEHFFRGVVCEVPFTGRAYRPDADELLTVSIPDQAKCFVNTTNISTVSHQDFNIKSLDKQDVKALFVNASNNGTSMILVQRFLSGQILRRKFSLVLSRGTYNRLDDEVFSLGNKLVCIFQDGFIKFKSMYALRSIIDMGAIYMEASKEDVRAFANHRNLFVSDEYGFVQTANEPIRKLIAAIMDDGVLENFSVEDIRKAAASTQLKIEVKNGRIVLPRERQELKALLQFLDESRYKGLFSGKIYATDNRRLA